MNSLQQREIEHSKKRLLGIPEGVDVSSGMAFPVPPFGVRGCGALPPPPKPPPKSQNRILGEGDDWLESNNCAL